MITSRAQWGADESLVADPPTYTTYTTAVFVHHTAGTNDYTCAESASLIRGILHTAAGDRGSEHLINYPTLYAKALGPDPSMCRKATERDDAKESAQTYR
ncbi:hypothetical protein [Streptomyces scopuliridis]|uniref:hypothetical protein n=1 Tax=Streptomyces scopuliridis TaxID=452529 RepID=UPI003679140B